MSAAPTTSHARLIDVLDALVRRAGHEPWGVRELAAELEESRSTVNRILASLVERGFAIEVGAGKYALGPRLRVLIQALSGGSSLLRQCRHALDVLADAAKRTALLSIHSRKREEYFVAACSETQAPLTFRPDLGVAFPPSFGDIGRAFTLLSPATRASQPGLGPFGRMSDSEFPRALSVATCELENGLLIAVSLHSLGDANSDDGYTPSPQAEDLARELAACVDAQPVAQPQLQGDEDKSTLARLERLMQLACCLPDGFALTPNLHELLLCNSATAKKVLQSAAEAGVVNVSQGRVYAGPKLYQWAARIGNQSASLPDLCRSILADLVDETGETVAFLEYDASVGTAQFLEVVQGWRPIQYKLQTYADVSLYAGAAGKAVLAHLNTEVARSLELTPFTEATITSHGELEANLEKIRHQGWSTGEGERVSGAFGLAVPFFVDGAVRGSISATIPQYRKDECDLPRLVERMQTAAGRIGKILSLGVERHAP